MLTRLPQKRSFAPPHPFPKRCANFGNERENGAMDTAYAPFAKSEILAATPFPPAPSYSTRALRAMTATSTHSHALCQERDSSSDPFPLRSM
jgi:hypothetical protein